MTDASTTVTAVAETTDRVREFLEPFEDVSVLADGTCALAYGSAEVKVTVEVFDEDQSVVIVRAVAVEGATSSPELHAYVATHRSGLGHLTVVELDDGKANLEFSHSLLGEFLNPAELRMTVVAVAYAADQLDDALAERFGGTVHDGGAAD